MAELNWAMAELERDPERWRANIGSPIEPVAANRPTRTPVTIAPTLVLLNDENGFVAYVTAAAPAVDAEALRLRYTSEVIAVQRLPSFAGVANFRISLAESVHQLAAPLRERVEVRARGCQPVEVSVAVEAFATREDALAQADPPHGHSWVEVAGWGAAAVGAAAVLVYFA